MHADTSDQPFAAAQELSLVSPKYNAITEAGRRKNNAMLEYLLEHGVVEDAELARPLLNHPNVEIQKLAARCIDTLTRPRPKGGTEPAP